MVNDMIVLLLTGEAYEKILLELSNDAVSDEFNLLKSYDNLYLLPSGNVLLYIESDDNYDDQDIVLDEYLEEHLALCDYRLIRMNYGNVEWDWGSLSAEELYTLHICTMLDEPDLPKLKHIEPNRYYIFIKVGNVK